MSHADSNVRFSRISSLGLWPAPLVRGARGWIRPMRGRSPKDSKCRSVLKDNIGETLYLLGGGLRRLITVVPTRGRADQAPG